jgi:hypothetical protein
MIDDLPLSEQLSRARHSLKEACIENGALRQGLAKLRTENERLREALAAHQQVGA